MHRSGQAHFGDVGIAPHLLHQLRFAQYLAGVFTETSEQASLDRRKVHQLIHQPERLVGFEEIRAELEVGQRERSGTEAWLSLPPFFAKRLQKPIPIVW
jgi:hypothetical protein